MLFLGVWGILPGKNFKLSEFGCTEYSYNCTILRGRSRGGLWELKTFWQYAEDYNEL